jgi:hypothetical protein
MDNYTTRIPPRRSAQRSAPTPAPDIEEDERYYRQPAQIQTSARRYVNTEGHEVIERGNKRLVIHHQPPSRRVHWLVLVGVGMLAAIVLFLAGNWAIGAWQAHQIDIQYGSPRTWQTDAVVGHNDSPAHPSHFIFLNLHAHVVIIEIPGGDISHARIYAGPTVFGPDADTVPITGSFEDVNGDGKPDLVVHIQGQDFVYLNDGTELKPQQ